MTQTNSEWPKSFRWHTAYCNEPDIVTFYGEDEIVTDYCGCIWSYSDCISCNAWVPTDQYKDKSPPAASHGDAKAEVAAIIGNVRVMLAHHEESWPIKSPYPEMIGLLADAVERLARRQSIHHIAPASTDSCARLRQ